LATDYNPKHEQRLFNEIMELLVTHYGGGLGENELDSEMDRLQHAFEFGRSSHIAQVRKSGEPYFFHPLRVAHLAARHWMDFSSIIAALLHDVVEDTPVTLDSVCKQYGDDVALLVNGLTKADDKHLNSY
jgi:GTP pyrophosphokinase